jgi:hypothetical protein
MTQKLRDERDSREQLAVLKAVLESEGKTVVEDRPALRHNSG